MTAIDATMSASRATRIARIGGVLYLVVIAIGMLEELLVRGSIVVAGDGAATLANLRSMQMLWRMGIAGELVLLSCAAVLSVILYRLLRPVHRDLALLAVVLNVISLSVEGGAAVALMLALVPLGSAPFLIGLGAPQLEAVTMLAIRAHALGFTIALVFFGAECVVLGHLIRRSGYMPRALGWLMQLAGVCYLTNGFVLVLSPALANQLVPAILLPCLVGELGLASWLAVKGVRGGEWTRRLHDAAPTLLVQGRPANPDRVPQPA